MPKCLLWSNGRYKRPAVEIRFGAWASGGMSAFETSLPQEGRDQVHRQDGIATLRGTMKDRDAVRSLVVDVYGAGVKDVVSKLDVEEE